jgi:[acyl-carrier-protein] S-malonyltransferase
MQEAVPVGQGTMAVVLGLSDDEVRASCAEAAAAGGVVEAVNFNAPAQVVIAGDTAAVERACEIAKGKGAKRAMKLPVSAPFHSSLLKPASDRLRDYLANIPFSVPQIALINNVDVAVLTDPAAIKDALVRQAAAPVRWVETVQKIAADGIVDVVECGPGKVLMGLTKRIDGNLAGDAIFDQASLDSVLSKLK